VSCTVRHIPSGLASPWCTAKVGLYLEPFYSSYDTVILCIAPAAEDNFCHEHERAHKPVTFEDYSQQMNYVDEGDRTANTYTVREDGSGEINYFFTCWI
jgi:hypothetical protein